MLERGVAAEALDSDVYLPRMWTASLFDIMRCPVRPDYRYPNLAAVGVDSEWELRRREKATEVGSDVASGEEGGEAESTGGGE